MITLFAAMFFAAMFLAAGVTVARLLFTGVTAGQASQPPVSGIGFEATASTESVPFIADISFIDRKVIGLARRVDIGGLRRVHDWFGNLRR